MKHIVKNDFSIANMFYQLKGVDYQIIATRSMDWSVQTCIDTIKNLETKETKEVSRLKLYKYTRQNNINILK